MKHSLYIFLLAFAAGYAQTPSLPGTGHANPAAAPAGRGTAPKSPATPDDAPAAGQGRGAASAASAVPSPKDLKYPPARSVQIPALTSFTLPNGMKLFLQEDHELPVISGMILVRTGSLFDPPERIGLAQLVGAMLRSGGTSLKTGEQVDNMLESLGASDRERDRLNPTARFPSFPWKRMPIPLSSC